MKYTPVQNECINYIVNQSTVSHCIFVSFIYVLIGIPITLHGIK